MARERKSLTQGAQPPTIAAVPASNNLIEVVRTTCLALPEVEQRASHGADSFFVRRKKSFCSIWADGHHDRDFPHLWLAAPPGAQDALVGGEPRHFFVPPYVGYRGWLGVRLDHRIEPDELEELCEDAYRTVAPATLIARLDGATKGAIPPSG